MIEAIEKLLHEDDFRVFVPNVADTVEKAGEDPEEARRIGGYCSTEAKDRQEEIVVAKGLEFDEFVRHGYFNDNHKQDTVAILGYPDLVRLEKGRWWTEGRLIKGYPPADQIWELAKSLKKSGGSRRLGFSIEGKVLERDGRNKILRAKVRHVAITASPVNTECFPGWVRCAGAAEKVSRRWYSGDFVEIVLSTGEKLSGTPNHPILTDCGWVALGALDESRHRVGRRVRDLVSAPVVSHDIQDVPPTFEEMFDFASVVGARSRVDSAGKEDFHGDGVDGHVDVVVVDRFLEDRLHAAFSQKFGKDALPAADKSPRSLSAASGLLLFFDAGARALSSRAGLSGKAEALFFGEGIHSVRGDLGGRSSATSKVAQNPSNEMVVDPEGLADLRSMFSGVVASSDFARQGLSSLSPRFGLTRASLSDQEPLSTGYVDDGGGADAEASSDGTSRLSRSIGFSDIRSKRVFWWSGHVYNLQTSHGWYEVEGIVAHNCSWDVIAKAFAPAEDVARAAEKALAAGHGGPASTGGSALRVEDLESEARDLRRDDLLSVPDVLEKVKRRWPHLKRSTQLRVVRHVMLSSKER